MEHKEEIDQIEATLKELEDKKNLKIHYFNTLHSLAKHMKPEIRDLEKEIEKVEKQLAAKKRN